MTEKTNIQLIKALIQTSKALKLMLPVIVESTELKKCDENYHKGFEAGYIYASELYVNVLEKILKDIEG